MVGDNVHKLVWKVGNPVGRVLVIVLVFQEHDVVLADLEPSGVRKAASDFVHGAVVVAIGIALNLDTDDSFSTPEPLILHAGAIAKGV